MTIEKDLFFPVEEYQGRVAAVQNELEEAGADALLVHQTHNIFYLTGYHAGGSPNYQFLLVPKKGDPILLVRELEKKLVDYYSWMTNIFSWEDTEEPIGVTKKVIEKAGLGDAGVGYEGTSNWITPRRVALFKEKMLEVRWMDLGGTVENHRLIKSPREIEYMRQATRYTEEGIRCAYEAIREGVTENDVAAACEAGMIRAGSEPLVSSPIINSGFRSSVAHTSFRRRKLEKGDTLIIEISGVYNRYTGPLFRSAVIGSPPEKLRELYDSLVEGLESAIAKIRPGVTSGDVDEACTGLLRKKGFYDYFKKRLGYSVGIGFPPGWGEGAIMDIKHNDPRELKAGMVFHLPPAMRVGDEWGFGVSETVVVTEKGGEPLSNCPRELAVR
jgi:Xaa-Pro dipeptidase